MYYIRLIKKEGKINSQGSQLISIFASYNMLTHIAYTHEHAIIHTHTDTHGIREMSEYGIATELYTQTT